MSSRLRPCAAVSSVAACVTLVLVLMLGGGRALAGGWAVSTLDPLERSPVAGRGFTVGFTIRQHGRTPVSLAGTAIVIRRPTGAGRVLFPAQEDSTGHYVATVRFPASGTWTWQVQQGWFAPQELGTIQVKGASSGFEAYPAGAATALSGSDLFRAKGCASCHDGPGSTAQVEVGPDLTNLPTVAASRVPALGAEDYVRRSITDPSAYVVPGYAAAGFGMPPLRVSRAEVDAIVAYLLRSR